ncbi:MAG: hypothetical protein B7Y37_11495, partial [Sphingobacteriia bacterium 28-36-52]
MKSKILLKILMPFFFLLTAFTVVGQSFTAVPTLAAQSETYGTASLGTSFSVNGTSLTTADVVVTVTNSAFEIRIGAGSWGASLNIPSGDIPATVDVRLKATANAGNYSGIILNLSGGGVATPLDVDIDLSTVAKKAITISGTSIASKTYDATTAAGNITLGTVAGLVGSETLAITPSATAYSSANVGAAYTSTVSYVIADG